MIVAAPRPEGKFPYLNLDDLSPAERSRRQGKLEKDSQQITRQFSTLTADTNRSLKNNNNVTVDLVVMLLDAFNMPGLLNCSKVPQVMIKMYQYGSFFNYELVETLITELGDNDVKTKLQGYLSNFEQYCMHKLSEVPISALVSDREVSTLLYVKTNKDFDVPLGEISLLKRKFSKLLDTNLLLINLRESDGCVELDFDNFKSDNLFAMDGDKLEELGITHVYTDDVTYYEETEEEQVFTDGIIGSPKSSSSSCEWTIPRCHPSPPPPPYMGVV